jgi:hypothetical protein
MTLIILQGFFLFFFFTDINFLGVLSWIGRGDSMEPIKLFLPLFAFGAIKLLYWFADPLSKLFIIILQWVFLGLLVYFVYWLFFV